MLLKPFNQALNRKLFLNPCTFKSVRGYSFTKSVFASNINMNMTNNINVPDEANLTGFALVNKRAANMIYTIYGERALTKILQIGGNLDFVGSLGRQTKYDVEVCSDNLDDIKALKEKIEFSSVIHIQPLSEIDTSSDPNLTQLYDMSHYRMNGYEIIVCLNAPISTETNDNHTMDVASMPLSQIAGLLTSGGCCIVGGSAASWKKYKLISQFNQLAASNIADMMSLQSVPCGVVPDSERFHEYPGEARFMEPNSINERHGEYIDEGDNDGLIVEDEVSKPYYIGLLRKR